MIRLFNVYYPIRTIILLVGEALIVWSSFLLGTVLQHGYDDGYLILNYEGGHMKILVVTAFVLIFSHWFDLYNPSLLDEKAELYFRLLLMAGMIALTLAVVGYLYAGFMLGNQSLLLGLIILTFALFGWRNAYSWLLQLPYLQERVYILGAEDRARRVLQGLGKNREMGIQVVGWSGNIAGAVTRESMGSHLLELVKEKDVHRVIVAMQDRRGTMPMPELLQLRLQGVHIEEATSWLEKMSGKIEVDQLYPSWILFAKGFRFSDTFRLVRRILNFSIALVGLVVALPLIPFIVLAVVMDSRGAVLYRQERVGRRGALFYCYKFRTMRQDAEADTGPTWAGDDDPRITRVGKFLRTARLDEIPQLWCVLKGDMQFVGPRPERPEFVKWLTEQIPYYGVRHMVRPGITGWAQVRYKYGNTIEDAKEKLQYDLYYIKNASIGFDMMILFHTVKTVLLGRGAR